MDSRDCAHYFDFCFVDIIKVFIETVLSTLRPVEAMEDADKALAQNKLSTKAIIAKVSLRFFLQIYNLHDLLLEKKEKLQCLAVVCQVNENSCDLPFLRRRLFTTWVNSREPLFSMNVAQGSER